MNTNLSTSVTRNVWLDNLTKLAHPILSALAEARLRVVMPVETHGGGTSDNHPSSHLEAFARLLCGIAPWLDGKGGNADEASLRAEMGALAKRGLANAVDPASPDYLRFGESQQSLVDTAFLAQAILRAPVTLWESADTRTQGLICAALRASRSCKPYFNNWLLFSAIIEATLGKLNAGADLMRIDYALRQHEQWYKGDGVYGDGQEFHYDYYNSFVIHPMLLDVLDTISPICTDWDTLREPVLLRAQRYGEILERVIAPDGSFPAVGRSLTYRCGAFHLLAQLALQERLPASLSPAQVRGALTAVIQKTLTATNTFDAGGWLRIGLCGHQPGLGEHYISTGSLYLCAAALLPLGLPEENAFWSSAPEPWTAQKVWGGADLPADHALHSA